MKRKLSIIFLFLMFFTLLNCTTNKLIKETKDPKIITAATYADALEMYVSLQDIYIPYVEIIKKEKPEAHAIIIANFVKARKILYKWKAFNALLSEDKIELRDLLRTISLELAKVFEERNN